MEDKRFWPKEEDIADSIYGEFRDTDESDDPYKSYKRFIDNEVNLSPALEIILCKNYLDYMKQNIYTLERAQEIAFLELYAEDTEISEYLEELDTAVKNGVSRKTARREVFKGLEVEESFVHFQGKYKKRVNRILEVLFGQGTDIEVCKVDKEGNDTGSYMIYADELQFFIYVVSEYEEVDIKNFIQNKFDKVSEEGMSMLLCGAKFLAENHKIPVSDEVLQNWMKIKLKSYQKAIYSTYQDLFYEISEIMNIQLRAKKYNVKLVEEFHECTDILKACVSQFEETVDKLTKKHYDLFSSPESTKKVTLNELKSISTEELIKHITSSMQ